MSIKDVLIFMVLVLSSLFMPTLQAQQTTGTTLLNDCEVAIKLHDNKEAKATTVDYMKSSACISYISGADDMHNFIGYMLAVLGDQKDLKKYYLYCLPPDFAVGQGIRIIVKYLKEHPEELHYPAAFLIANIFKINYPCKERQTTTKTTNGINEQNVKQNKGT